MVLIGNGSVTGWAAKSNFREDLYWAAYISISLIKSYSCLGLWGQWCGFGFVEGSMYPGGALLSSENISSRAVYVTAVVTSWRLMLGVKSLWRLWQRLESGDGPLWSTNQRAINWRLGTKAVWRIGRELDYRENALLPTSEDDRWQPGCQADRFNVVIGWRYLVLAQGTNLRSGGSAWALACEVITDCCSAGVSKGTAEPGAAGERIAGTNSGRCLMSANSANCQNCQNFRKLFYS